ncbi:phosphatase PAP2 family protein [Uliginosibacterium sp. H1]|uniref:phosphatase PAP2 family protein n=1 Tax=Uliginosibacterium sp. H1 TaxID=3114757 RepID=UPI002E178E7B|nr:phosphatase PAP2 family protein [Uliginosibacterium sp. H1]
MPTPEELALLLARHASLALAAIALTLACTGAGLSLILSRHGDALLRALLGGWSWLAPRWRLPPTQVALLLALGFAFALATSAAFLSLADEISEHEELTRFDIALAEALRTHAEPAWQRFFATLTHLGDVEVLVGVGVLVGIVLLAKRRYLDLACWTAATLGNGLLIRLLKHFFQRERPAFEHGLVSVSSWSFPSGHASGSLVVYGMLSYLLLRALPAGARAPLLGAACMLVMAIGFSRIYLHVHFASDVLAGYASGLTWMTMCIIVCEATRARSLRPA